jgi:hypothetical protein
MISLSSLFRPKLSFAIVIYLLSLVALGFLVQAQLDATELFQAGRPMSLR